MGIWEGDEKDYENLSTGQRHYRILYSSNKEANVNEFLEWVKNWFKANLDDIDLIRSGKKKIRCISKEAASFNVKGVIRGIYIAKKAPYGYILSIEGSWIVGKRASRHVVELNEDHFSRWMRGEDISLKLEEKGVYIVRYGPVFTGSGYYDGNTLHNLVPKSRVVEY